MQSKVVSIIFILIVIFFIPKIVSGQQAAYETFGQNRIQYRSFKWSYYDTAHFRVMYYDQGLYNAQFILQQAELDLPPIVFAMGAHLSTKIDIVLYNNYSEYKQTNIGKYNEDWNLNNNGMLELNRNVVAVYFDGNHQNLRKQVRRGIAKIIKDNLLFGENLKEVIRNARKMNLPNWFTDGYIEFVSQDWDADRLGKLRSMLAKNEDLDFAEIATIEPTLAGQSLFHYINEKYKENAINNILHLVRSGKNVPTTLKTVLQIPNDELFENWKEYYANPLDATLVDTTNGREYIGKIKTKPGAVLSKFSISPDGSVIAYCETKDGKYDIKLYEIKTKRFAVIQEGGIRSNLELKDPNYPLICWSIDGKKAAFMYENDYQQRLKIYDAKKGRINNRVIPRKSFERITGMAFMEDDEKLIMTCIRKGQSDLFQFTFRDGGIYPVTKDIWNDVSPTYVRGAALTGILFLSNRPKPFLSVKITNNELPNTPFNLFYLDKINGTGLKLLSKDIEYPITQPIQYGNNRFACLIEKNGSKQRYIINLAKDAKGNDSNYYYKANGIDYNILYHDNLITKGEIMDVIEKRGEYYLYKTNVKILDSVNALQPIDTITTLLIPYDSVKRAMLNTPSAYILNEFDNDIDNVTSNIAQKKDPYMYDPAKDNTLVAANPKLKKFKNYLYKPLFTTDYFQNSVDRSLLFNRYQRMGFGDSNNNFQFPSIGYMMRISLMDVLEDYKLSGAFRIPLSLTPTIGYYLKFANYKKRLDWEITFSHNSAFAFKINALLDSNSTYWSPKLERAKMITNYLNATFTYPFSPTTSVRLETGLRQDRQKYNAQTEYSLKFPSINEYWNFNRIEYIIDNTYSPITNIHKGTRLKVYSDIFVQLKKLGGNMYTVGGDLRNYTTIYKNIIVATRLAFAHSGGKSRMLYRVGGIDNEILPSFNTNLPVIDSTVNYGYQTNATTVRGYTGNARNGDTYFMLNEEIRIPVMNSITNKKFKNKVLRNLMLVGFVDVAQVGKGLLLDGADYYFISNTVKQGVRVSTRDVSTPIMFGYGFGVRTTISGYYLRADIGWSPYKRLPHYSIGTSLDF